MALDLSINISGVSGEEGKMDDLKKLNIRIANSERILKVNYFCIWCARASRRPSIRGIALQLGDLGGWRQGSARCNNNYKHQDSLEHLALVLI